ncbi:Bug family tripartite tricarboxylate transporter substrate binding protein [Paracoccus pantotrophus]|uniref:Bug family tripartite tricarboxylate transporter substrate binding protein n=1 Tax=Paracoccus pantotrophus TaxID=82367 RepID=UPI0004ADCDF7|nr:tripartite tricarboxylate transporter substrate binding protein [Paracoccus pantotrophus]
MRRFRTMLAAAVLGVLPIAATAQGTYPERPITMIVPFAAGNSADILARVLADHVGRQLNTSIVIENRPGAESILGATTAARARADGYTIMLASTSALAAAPALNKNLPYDPVTDFTPITQISLQPYVIVVRPDHPAEDISQLIQMAKDDPGRITFASSNTTTRVASELFRSMAGIELTNIPYTGTDQAFLDVRNGQVAMMFAGSTSALPQIAQGTLRPLAVSSADRWEELPDVPTLGEVVPGYEFSAWHALVAPAAAPDEAISVLNAAFHAAMNDPDIAAQVDVALFPTTPDELSATIQRDIDVWHEIVEEAGLPVN